MIRKFGPRGPKPVAIADLFWSHVEVAIGDQCWKWHGATTQFGYGQIKSAQKKYGAHRVSWELHYGPIANGLLVCHKCDNPPCTNPKHLFLGTAADNSADCRLKGRRKAPRPLRGESNPRAKLTVADVISIRNDPRSQPKIAKDYGVSHILIGKIKRREAWRHVP